MTSYRLAYPAAGRVEAPALDRFQQSVVDHAGGPLLVLAGPGTGKTTTLVEAVVDRIERRAVSPESVLALTFSRKAAEQLRDRVTARLGRTMSTQLSSTFHSFAYALLRRYSPGELYAAPLRLLSAPEQDVVLQQLLEGTRNVGFWPEALTRAVGTRGFAREVQAVLARAREKGLDPVDLKRLADESGLPELAAAARFMQQYQVILDDQSAIDYPELIYRAVLLSEQPQVRRELRDRFTHVFVDEYQDTDPSQVRLLRSLAGDGRDLTVVGDPDQSIYAFRGAQVRGILDFPREFRRHDGSYADVVALRVTRRFGSRLLRASRAVVSSVPTTGSIGADAFRAFRNPESGDNGLGPGRVEVRTFDTERAETEHVADLLRRAHLEDGVAWSEMAVLVRSGRGSIPVLRRSLAAAGVPVEVAADDTPLVREPAVQPLLGALHAVVNLDNDDPADPDFVGPDRAEALLVSPLAGLDATEVRTLGRRLRSVELEAATAAGRSPRPSAELLRCAVLDPAAFDPADVDPADVDPVTVRVTSLAALLRSARSQLEAGATAEQVLWTLWDGTSWPRRLRGAVELGGPAARLAHRDLDAICALFEVAARAEEQRGHTSVSSFLASLTAQQIPADTLAERGVRGAAVRLLTAHRSKGLEWRLVVVAHVQEEGWPDLRRRATLMHADRLGPDGLLPPPSIQAVVAEERRLFYVACTRARQRLLVTAVESPEDDGEQPSRFLDELDVPRTRVQGRPTRPLSMAGLVAELRRTVADPATPSALRQAAANRLARLAQEGDRGRPLVPEADPASWWGTRGRSVCDRPLREVDQPVPMSASALSSLLTCPVQWFLEREAGGARRTSQSQGFGQVVHALADRIAKGELAGNGTGDAGAGDAAETVLEELMGHVDRVWGQIPFRTPWSAAKERAEVEAALRRFLQHHRRDGARTILATEQELSVEVTLPGGERVRLIGYADRLELDEDGRVVVIDLKTGKYPPPDKELPANPQLGLYQLAVERGAVDDLTDGRAKAGGAELWQLRRETRGQLKVQAQAPQKRGEDGLTEVERQLTEAVATLRSERLVATPGKHCEHCAFQALCPAKVAGTVLS